MRKDTLYITLSRDITSYTITSGQRAIATNVNYAVTIESPTLTTNLAGRDVSVIISDTEGNTLTTATTFYPDTKNPYKAVTGSLLLDGTVYAKFFDGKPVDTAVRLPIVIRDKSATLLSSDIVVMNGGASAEPSASDETIAGLVNAIRFYDLAEFKAWLDGTLTRDDGLMPTDIVVGQWVHTQNDGSFICKELIGAEPSVAKNFTAIVTQFPLTGTLKMNPDNGVGLSVYSGDVYNEADATSFSTDAITYKGDSFTFNAGDNQIARQKDNYALENRVNSTMKSTLDAIKADNDDTYAAMLPVRNETVEARYRAETAARGAKASETRAITAEENAATSEQNAEASKKSAAVSEANAGLYRQQALAYSQKAETEAATATTKATEAATSASEASASAGEALAHKNDAGSYAESARLSAEASAGSAESSEASAAASKSSAETAAQSESIAVGSAAAAASSESTASQYKDTAVSASSLAVTSKDSASNFADAAASSATAAAKSAAASASSASAAKQSETDLAEAVATAESLDGRLDALEGGTGAYFIQSRDVIPQGKPTSADVGKVLYFDHFANETTSTLAVTNSTPWAQKVCPAPIVANEPNLCAVGCFDYTKNKKYIVFMTAISVNPIGYLYELYVDGWSYRKLTFKSKLATSYFSDASVGASYWCRNICVHDGFVFYTRRHHSKGPHLTVCEVDTGKLITNIDLDPKNTGDIYVNSAIWYNPLSGHICVLCYAFSLPSGETWGGSTWNNKHFIRVFKWNAGANTLEDIPDGDRQVTIIDVTEAVTEALGNNDGYGVEYGSTWPIRDQVFLSIRGVKQKYMALFHATADDRIEPCYEWDVEYETDGSGITRPVWETQPEEWTDADGNTQTIQNYVRNYDYDAAIVPKMTKGRVLKFMCAAGYDGVPSGTWSANPVFTQPLYAFGYSGENALGAPDNYPSMPVLTDGVVRWTPLSGYKFVRQEALNGWGHLKSVKRPARDGATGLYLLNDVRKGSARKFSGWLPKSGQYIASTGATTGDTKAETQFGTSPLLVALTAAQSGTPLSRIGMVNNAGTDSAAMTPLPITATYSSGWWLSSMLPYCPWGFFGNVWMTTYNKTIGGVL